MARWPDDIAASPNFGLIGEFSFDSFAYVLIRIAQGEWRRIHPLMLVAAGAFTLYFLIPLLHDNLSWI